MKSNENNVTSPQTPSVSPEPSIPTPPCIPSYNLAEAVFSCLIRFTMVKGRACRAEFWWYTLVYCLLHQLTCGYSSLPLLLPTIAVSCRRMHDVGKPAWCTFIPIYSLYLALLPTAPSNVYGSAPLPPEKI